VDSIDTGPTRPATKRACAVAAPMVTVWFADRKPH
jgi:hypothetical protein